MALISLADVLKELRSELATAQAEGRGQGVRFKIEQAEVELQFVAEDKGEAGGGVKLYVVDLSGGVASRTAATQRVTLQLKVTDGGGGSPLISDEDTVG